jgi:hypothetical protein
LDKGNDAYTFAGQKGYTLQDKGIGNIQAECLLIKP